VAPIGAVSSPERKHSNIVLKFIIKPVLEELGFAEPVRADMLSEPGIIGRQIVSRLIGADLVIADLTGHNPNVFYELAIRHGTGKPFIQLIARGEIIPFDVGHQRTIQFDRTDLEDVELCKAELKSQIEATRRPDFHVETPIGHALDFERLRGGGTTEQALAVLVDRLDRIDAMFRHQATPHATFDLRALVAQDSDFAAIYDEAVGWAYKNKVTGDSYVDAAFDLWKQAQQLHGSGRIITPAALRVAAARALDDDSFNLAKHLGN
jgi:hypothetical protein